MADSSALRISGIGPADVTPQPVARDSARIAGDPAPVRGTTPQTEQAGQAQEADDRAQKPSKEALENVVAVSEFGDTVQVSDDGEDIIENGAVTAIGADTAAADNTVAQPEENFSFAAQTASAGEDDARADAAEQRAQAAEARAQALEQAAQAQTAAENDSPAAQTTSFAGYTENQIKNLYERGEISRFDYENEIAAREDRMQAQADEDAQRSEALLRDSEKLADLERTGRAVETAYSDDASRTLAPEQRVEILEAAEAAASGSNAAADNAQVIDRNAQAAREQEDTILRNRMQNFQINIS